MKADFYKAIKTALLTVKELRGNVKLWHNTQINSVDTLASYPFALVELGLINYEDNTNKVQECNVGTFTVHIIEKSLTGDEDRIFEVTQAVYKAMRDEQFFRVSEQPVYDGSQIIDWQIVFEAQRFMDEDAKILTTSVVKADTAIDIEEVVE